MSSAKAAVSPAPSQGASPPPHARRSRWLWRVFAALFVGLLLAGGAAFFWVRQALKGGSAEELAERLPADVSFVLIGRGVLDHVYEFWSLFDGEQALDAARRAELAALGQQLLGFDVTSGRAWLEAGLDPTRPWGIAVRSRAESGWKPEEVAILVASRDDAALEQTALKLLASRGTTPERLGAGKLATFKAGAGAFAIREGFLTVVLAQDAERANERLASYVPGGEGRLADDPNFTAAVQSQADDWHLLAYAPGTLLAPLRKEVPPLAQLAPRGVVATMRASDEQVAYRLTLLSAPDAPVTPNEPTDLIEPLDRHIPGEALATVRLQLQPQSAWASLRSGLGQALSMWSARVLESTGIDLERDVINNFDGRLTLVLLPGKPTEHVPVNAVLYAGVPQPERWKTLLDLSLPKLPDHERRPE